MAVGVFSSAKGGACLRASDRDGLSCAAKYARREPACSYTYTQCDSSYGFSVIVRVTVKVN